MVVGALGFSTRVLHGCSGNLATTCSWAFALEPCVQGSH